MLSIKEIKSKLTEINSDLYATIFGADQSPRKSQRAYWVKFLNQETGIQFGTEKFAKEFNAVVIFTNIYKVKRGYYELQYDVITEQPNEEEFGYISKTHTEMLEKVIQEQPEFWLWSHKRWKHKRPEDEILH
jgi:KDO2-lipid IV(A) lauroyltransferase